MFKRFFLLTLLGIFISIGLLPLVLMFADAFFNNPSLSFKTFSSLFHSEHNLQLMLNSLKLSVSVTLITTLLGVSLGFILAKTDLSYKKTFIFIFLIPLLIPSYILAISWANLIPHELLFGFYGSVLVLSSTFVSIPMLISFFFLQNINPQYEEVASLMAGKYFIFKHITLPLLLKSISFSMVIVFLLSFADVNVTNYFRYQVYILQSFTQFSAFYDVKSAVITTLPLVFITLVVLLSESFFLRKKNYKISYSSHYENHKLLLLGKLKIAIFLAISVLCFIFVLLPLNSLFIDSLNLESYVQAFKSAKESLFHSLSYAFISATLLSFFGFFMAYAIQAKILRFHLFVDFLSLFLFALPSTILGIGLVYLYNNTWTNFIYATPLIIIFAYVAKYLILSIRIFLNHLSQISPSMEEAAQMSGASWFRRIFFILFPLLKNAFVLSWIIGYIFSLRDTSLSMLVYPAGYETLSVKILTLMANGSSSFIAALCIYMILSILLPGLLLLSFLQKKEKNAYD